MPLELSALRRSLPKRGQEQDSVWPTLSLVLYADLPAPELGPTMASFVERYIAAIPPDALKATLIRDQVGPLTQQRLERDLRSLRKPGELEMKVYSSSERGQPNDHGCSVFMRTMSPEQQRETLSASVVRVEFPWAMANGPADELAETLMRLADGFPFSCGTAGLGFSYWASDRLAADQVRSMLPRYIGFEHSDCRFTGMYGKTPSPSWLTFLSHDRAAQLPGMGDLMAHLPENSVTELRCGLCVRAAWRPPVGDVNRQASDIGALPSIARWLQPLRFRTRGFAGSQVDMDVDAWLARFDERTDQPWRNSEG